MQDYLLDSLVMVAKLEGRPTTPDALVSGLPLVNGLLTPELFPRAAERIDLSAKLSRRDLREIPPETFPAVVLCREDRACVLLEIDGDEAIVLDPEVGDGIVKLSLDTLDERYTGHVFYVKPKYQFDERAEGITAGRDGHWFWSTLLLSWKIYRDVLVASFMINIFALVSPLFIRIVYNSVLPNSAVETLWVLTSGVFVAILFDVMMRMLRTYFIDIAGKKSDLLLSARIFEQMLGLRMEHKPVSVGGMVSNLREFDSIREFITSTSITALIDLPFALLFLLVIWSIGGSIVWIGVVAITLSLLYSLIAQRFIQETVKSSHAALAQRGGILHEALSGLETIKFLGVAGVKQLRWERVTGHIADWSIKMRLFMSSTGVFSSMMSQLSQLGVIVMGAHMIYSGELGMGGLIACMMLIGRAVSPMTQVALLIMRYSQSKIALDSLNKLMALPIDRPERKTFISKKRFGGEIEFDHVSFQYPGSDVMVLNDVSFRIKPGEHVAIVGPIGMGKSTIAKLIMGLYSPTSGAVRIDGVDVKQLDPADLRRNIGYVSQEGFLFFGTLRDNITVAAPNVSDEDIIRVSNLTGVSEFVKRHPSGFNMEVGERGGNLSGGQRQAVTVARALIRSPAMFVMDEPTNLMDRASEMRLKDALHTEIDGCTLVLISHSSAMLDLTDRVIVLEAGRIRLDRNRNVAPRKG